MELEKDVIQYELAENGLATIWLNRPHKRNFVSPQLLRELEAADTYPRAMADKLAEMGLFGATISPEHGGLGLPALTYSKIIERLSAVWISWPRRASIFDR